MRAGSFARWRARSSRYSERKPIYANDPWPVRGTNVLLGRGQTARGEGRSQAARLILMGDLCDTDRSQ